MEANGIWLRIELDADFLISRAVPTLKPFINTISAVCPKISL
jgi:hypothetical protein